MACKGVTSDCAWVDELEFYDFRNCQNGGLNASEDYGIIFIPFKPLVVVHNVSFNVVVALLWSPNGQVRLFAHLSIRYVSSTAFQGACARDR
jgi:hypothetical protein